jgi:hypothetical protein
MTPIFSSEKYFRYTSLLHELHYKYLPGIRVKNHLTMTSLKQLRVT